MNPIDSNAEWIEADGLGGFASGTVSGIRSTRTAPWNREQLSVPNRVDNRIAA